MAARFNPLEADAHWQKVWEERGTFHASGSSAKPSRFSCDRIVSMFCQVHSPGWTFFSIAAFSAGMPKASQPIGCRTLKPRAR